MSTSNLHWERQVEGEALEHIPLVMVSTEITISTIQILNQDKWTTKEAVVKTDGKKDSSVSVSLSLLRKSKPKEGFLLLMRETLIALSTTETEATTAKEQEDLETVKFHFVVTEVELREVVSELFEHSNRGFAPRCENTTSILNYYLSYF